jgi:hypothetical protein
MLLHRVAFVAALGGATLALAGCALNFLGTLERRAAWHDQEERACVASRQVAASAFVQPIGRINDRGACGISRPLKITAFAGGRIGLGPTATLNCPMTAAVEAWLTQAVQPAAYAWFGTPVVEIKQISAYSCRPINNIPGEDLSEHGYGNALDVAGFTLANGRTVTVKKDWNSDVNAKGFLREVFAAACERFKTVLGPGVEYHGDHFHLDLAHHGSNGTSHYCKPVPDGLAPQRQLYEGSPLIALSRGLSGGGWAQGLDPSVTGAVSAYAAE